MIMKPSFEADKFRYKKSSLNAKKPGCFKTSAGFRVALPSLRPYGPWIADLKPWGRVCKTRPVQGGKLVQIGLLGP